MDLSQQRYKWITALRGFAALSIIFIHVIGGWTSSIQGGGITGARWYLDYVFIQVCVRWAVPCFIMISGFLLLDDKKEIGFQKLKKYIIKMISVLLTFGLAYCFMEAAANEGLENIPYVAAVSVKNLIEGRSWTHMWYIYMMLGLYLMLPLFRAFTKSADEKTYRFVLIVLFLLTIVRPTINGLFKTAIEIQCHQLKEDLLKNN